MKFFNALKGNIVLKITSLNAVVISIRLIISVFVQRLLALMVGEAGIASVGQVRNLLAMLVSTSTLGTFSGVVKYVSEFKDNTQERRKLFSTVGLFILVGSLISSLILFFTAEWLSDYLFNSTNYNYVPKILAFIVPFIAIGRVFNGVVNGLSDYKKYAVIELVSYVLAAAALVVALLNYDLQGVLIAIAIAPAIHLAVLVIIFGKVLFKYVEISSLSLRPFYANKLLAFTLMSFVSSFLVNYVELHIRTVLTNQINVNEAGYWTAMTFISKNYMVFATGLFTLYVLPKFASIKTQSAFLAEVLKIYKTILPLFGLGMVLVFLFKDVIIQIIYPDFLGMRPLFKWQLLGDFVRLAALVLSHQFLAKRLVKSYVATEIISLILFYVFTYVFIEYYGTEGVVMAHFVRYIFYFAVVAFLIWMNFKAKKGD